MQAFPEGSLNMQIGGSGPVNKNIDLNQYHGIGQEAHIDYSRAAAVDADAAYVNRPTRELGRDGGFNTIARVEPVHGSESVGLGTSTFLEGAPASRAAIARRESENEAAQQVQSLSRKKSVAQRIRTMRSNTITNRDRTISPDGSGTPITPLEPTRSESNVNPFFKDYDHEYEKKGQQIAVAEAQEKRSAELTGRARAPSSPRRGLGLGLERMKTADSIGGGEDGVGKPESKATGILNRMKSLKGGRRARPERRETSG
jgi:Pal1 cell morphology protein